MYLSPSKILGSPRNFANLYIYKEVIDCFRDISVRKAFISYVLVRGEVDKTHKISIAKIICYAIKWLFESLFESTILNINVDNRDSLNFSTVSKINAPLIILFQLLSRRRKNV